jgi:UPF0042 nucleotide-binding protein
VIPRLIIISGSSGAGKSSALRLLEDEGYYCVDNLPPRMMADFAREVLQHRDYDRFKGIAVCIDARAMSPEQQGDSSSLQQILKNRDSLVVFLDAQPHILLKRFSETRRRHPLAGPNNSLPEAITRERQHLEFIAAQADLLIDTTDLSPRDLRDAITLRIIERRDGISIMIESFAFKKGMPTDADFVFDARGLSNPYWEAALRNLTGIDEPVKRFLESDSKTLAIYERISTFVTESIPDFNQNDRRYLTIAIGCTGGQHRSVYLAERLHADVAQIYPGAQLRHRHLTTRESA